MAIGSEEFRILVKKYMKKYKLTEKKAILKVKENHDIDLTKK